MPPTEEMQFSHDLAPTVLPFCCTQLWSFFGSAIDDARGFHAIQRACMLVIVEVLISVSEVERCSADDLVRWHALSFRVVGAG